MSLSNKFYDDVKIVLFAQCRTNITVAKILLPPKVKIQCYFSLFPSKSTFQYISVINAIWNKNMNKISMKSNIVCAHFHVKNCQFNFILLSTEITQFFEMGMYSEVTLMNLNFIKPKLTGNEKKDHSIPHIYIYIKLELYNDFPHNAKWSRT